MTKLRLKKRFPTMKEIEKRHEHIMDQNKIMVELGAESDLSVELQVINEELGATIVENILSMCKDNGITHFGIDRLLHAQVRDLEKIGFSVGGNYSSAFDPNSMHMFSYPTKLNKKNFEYIIIEIIEYIQSKCPVTFIDGYFGMSYYTISSGYWVLDKGKWHNSFFRMEQIIDELWHKRKQ
jgi:hypothetical protein